MLEQRAVGWMARIRVVGTRESACSRSRSGCPGRTSSAGRSAPAARPKPARRRWQRSLSPQPVLPETCLSLPLRPRPRRRWNPHPSCVRVRRSIHASFASITRSQRNVERSPRLVGSAHEREMDRDGLRGRLQQPDRVRRQGPRRDAQGRLERRPEGRGVHEAARAAGRAPDHRRQGRRRTRSARTSAARSTPAPRRPCSTSSAGRTRRRPPSATRS